MPGRKSYFTYAMPSNFDQKRRRQLRYILLTCPKIFPPPPRMYAFSRNSFNYLSKRKKYSSIRGNTTKTWDFIVVVRCIFWVNYFKLKKFDNPTWWKNNATLTYVSCKHQRIATSLFLTSVITTQWTPKRPILRWLWGWHVLTNDAFH